MSTESRIEAPDAKAAGGVVAEGRSVLATFGQESWRVVVDDEGYANLHFASEDECLGDILATAYQDDEYAHGIVWMRNNLAAILDALTAAQAREAALREERVLPTPEEQDRLFEAWTREWADCANPVRTHGPLWRYLSGKWSGRLYPPTPEASTSPADAGREGWALVPREPTEAMIEATKEPLAPVIAGMIAADDAGHIWTDKPGVCIMADVYRAMLAAAPTPEAPDHD